MNTQMQKVEDSLQVGDLVASVSADLLRYGEYGVVVIVDGIESVRVRFFGKTRNTFASEIELRKIMLDQLPKGYRQQAAHIIAKLLCGMEI
jgi:hypothetical protein